MKRLELAQYIYDELGVKEEHRPPRKIVSVYVDRFVTEMTTDQGERLALFGKCALDVRNAEE